MKPEIKANEIFNEEWNSRFNEKINIRFIIENESDDEGFSVCENNGITVSAHRLRGLIYGIGMILRNTVSENGKPVILDEAFGSFSPDMPKRGHGIGYTDMSNSYEAWSREQFRRYILELMYFGLNTVETSYSATDKRTVLMKYDFKEAFEIISSCCEEFDAELTVWYSLRKSKTDEETIAEMLDVYGNLPKITSLFIPGGDPGDLLPEDFLRRCKKIKQAFSARFPDIELLPSAQAPHEYPDWRERFTKLMNDCPEEIDGIIYAPNHAMPLDDLRRTIDKRYPLEHFPDISHNIRCETPVHFLREDWHFAWASTLSRECVNPRPLEYQLLHKRTRQYVDGQISYSEGIHDDVNKVIWSALDFDFYASLKEILRQYSRLFFVGADENIVADGILGLEQNWNTAPEYSVSVEPTYELLRKLNIRDNWRFNLLLFRSACDKAVRDRRIFELKLLKKAESQIFKGNIAEAKKILETDYDDEYKALRASLFPMAQTLFDEIGLQLDVENFKGMSWERGCVLETIDMPITDRKYLLNKIKSGLSQSELIRIINRGKTAKDEYYFSFAFDGFAVCGQQDGEFYFDFKGDQNKNENLPMCMLRSFDHFNFRTRVAGLTGGNYILRITYKNRNHDGIEHHKVSVNGNIIFDGAGFGGSRDEAFEKLFLADGYQSIVYDIPEKIIENGCIELEITEPTVGFVVSEYWFEKNA